MLEVAIVSVPDPALVSTVRRTASTALLSTAALITSPGGLIDSPRRTERLITPPRPNRWMSR